jgi:chorismate--pyruvate lyase
MNLKLKPLMSAHWYQADSPLLAKPPIKLVDWLLDPGSFMLRLKRFGVQDAKVKVLSQRWEVPATVERYQLSIQPRQYALVREVLIGSPKQQWMFARTVIPAATLTGREQLLARIKSRSLGTLLFKNPHMARSEFEMCCVKKTSAWFEEINAHAKLKMTDCWARRSVFFLRQKSLLLTEVFLPDLMEL